ncbi:MAG: hypothetical protein WBB48_06400 [Thermodesulfobacteriota bacterium]
MLNQFVYTRGFKILNLTILAMVLVTFVISCSQEKKKEEPGQVFDEAKDYTIKYKLEGANEEERLVYSQDWGKCVMEIVGNQKIIASMENGQQFVTSIDMDSNTGTKMANPIYQSLLESLNAKTPKEFNYAILEKMGGKVVGEKTILGNKCEVWEMGEGVQTTCLTQDGIILESESSVSGTERRQIATEVIRGSTEGVDACSPGDAKIEVKNMNQLLQQQESDTPILELESEENNIESSEQEEKSSPETEK